MNRYLVLVLFILCVVGGGLTIGTLTAPGDWYAGLNKPSFNPPGWVFGPVWTVLYIAIAVAGWWTWERNDQRNAGRLWWMQLVLNFAWSPAFFAAQQIGLALVIILALLLTIIAFIVATWRSARTASLLFLPYAAWVAFASILNAAIFVAN